ncbi:hypothetical protein BC351_21055 [Paenibacillus ferrarius]|uniref:Uncharacterized protein n=1 Tax=Paenibacillus ferrarius TaxID=1469647 RepID=A0A1V4HNW1_9BACL|nr:hypothetical protein [Paenibacillus ferrarius]OPH59398.1 hypothetical protein BC351_21055 [Paenibacillus ferrarius]
MNVLMREKEAQMLTHVTGYQRRFYRLALFALVVTLILLVLKGTSSGRIGEPEVVLSPAVISMLPEGSDDSSLPVSPPKLAAQEDAGTASNLSQAVSSSSILTSLVSLEGISLEDNTADVTAKKGAPLTKVEDPQFIGETIYQYPDVNVGFYEDVVAFVQVPARAGRIQINDQEISLTLADIKQLLGEPDFVAEDGVVFQRKEALIKLFMQPDTQNPISIDYYHLSST